MKVLPDTNAFDCVVSGDRDLLDVSSYEGIVVLSPRDFFDQLQ